MNRSMNDQLVCRLHYIAAPTATFTPTNGIDVSDLESAEVIVICGVPANAGASPDPSWSFALQEGDTVAGSHTAVAEAEVARNSGNNQELSSGVFAVVNTEALDNTIYRLGYLGTKKSIKVVGTAADTPGATPIAVLVVGRPRLRQGALADAGL